MNHLRFPWLPLFVALLTIAVAASAWWSGAPPALADAQTAAIPPAAPDSAATVTLYAVADATIKSGQPTANFGSATTLAAFWGGVEPVIERAVVRFDLSSIPTNALIDHADLRLLLTDATGGTVGRLVTVRAFLVTSGWDESSVTWSNQPSVFRNESASIPVDTTLQDYTWDATTLARSWLAGPNYGLELRGPESGSTITKRAFASREYGEVGPRLIVTYSLPTATPTPTATNTNTVTPKPPTPTYTPTPTVTNTVTPKSPTNTYTPTPTVTNTVTPKPPTPTLTATPTPTNTPTPTTTGQPPVPTNTPTVTPTSGSPGPQLYVLPSAARPGTGLLLSGYAFPASGDFQIRVVAGATAQVLGQVASDAAGQINATLALPGGIAPGSYTLQARTRASVVLASAPLTVLAPLTLQINPASGPPGTTVSFTVGNLAAGTLRLDYAGLAVVGPLAVGAGSYTGSFVVPGDRPQPLGAVTTVRATNLAGKNVLGTAEVSFASQTAPAPVNYTFTDMVYPTGRLAPGANVVVNGRIAPAPPAGSVVVGQWQAGSKNFATAGMQATVGADGHFLMATHAPSLISGDPLSMPGSAGVGLTLNTPLRTSAAASQIEFQGSGAYELAVKVRDAATQAPVDGAIILIWPPYVHQEGSLGTPSGPKQISTESNGGQFRRLQPMCLDPAQTIGGLTNRTGQWERSLTQEELHQFVTQPLEGAEILFTEQQYGLPVTSPGVMQMGAMAAGAAPDGSGSLGFVNGDPETGWYTIQVDALLQCHALTDANGNLTFYKKKVYFSSTDGRILDENLQTLPHPLIVELPAIPEARCPKYQLNPTISPGELESAMADLGHGPVPVLGRYPSFAGVAADGGDSVFELIISQNFSDSEGYSLEYYRVLLDGVESALGCRHVYQGEINADPCNPDQEAPALFHYWTCGLNLPISTRSMSPGLHDLEVRLKAKGVDERTRHYALRFEARAVPAWYSDPAWRDRYAWFDNSGLHLQGAQYTDDPEEGSLNGDLPGKVGHQENHASVRTDIYSHVYLDGSSTTKLTTDLAGSGFNSPELQKHVDVSSAAQNPIAFVGGPETLVETGWVNLFQGYYGVWPIAEARWGFDARYSATWFYLGTIEFDAEGRSTTTLVNIPAGNIGLRAWLSLGVLFDTVEAGVEGYPKVSFSLPVTLKNGNVESIEKCFGWRFDTKWWFKVGCCMCFGACKKWEECHYNWLAGHSPDSLACSDPVSDCEASGASAAAMGDAAISEAYPAVATDGFGHTQALWLAPDGRLTAGAFDGRAWATLGTLATGPAGYRPRLAYYAPDRAVAGWVESSLTPELFATATISDAVKAQHVGYALWDGKSWSAGADLTQPSTGDASLSLAACPSTTAGCPAGGAVTAVWVRDSGAGLALHQQRLFYATFDGSTGRWGAAQAVDPGNTSAMDSQPRVVYSEGQPVIFWVRDADRNLGTLADHRIALRRLDSPVQVPPTLPDAILEIAPAVAADGGLRLAFTRADSGALLQGADNLYWAAENATAHAWTYGRLQDSAGRNMRAAGPLLTFDRQGRGTITFRGMGFGPLPAGGYKVAPQETVGMLNGTGELAQVEVSFDGAAHDPHYLTQDGAVYWQTAAVYDPVTDNTLALAVKGDPVPMTLAAGASALAGTAGAQAMVEDSPVVAASVPQQPEFGLAALRASHRYPQEGQAVSVEVGMRNDGVSWAATGAEVLRVQATWDGDPGVGAAAGQAQVTSLAAGQAVSLTLALTPPPGGYGREHTLTLTANPGQAITEISAQNNTLTTPIGGLTPPAGLWAAAAPDAPRIYLSWTTPQDSRIAGYRVYRSTDGSAPVPAGGTFVGGWIDLTSEVGHTYRYQVVSYGSDGFESAPTEVMQVALKANSTRRTYLPLVRK